MPDLDPAVHDWGPQERDLAAAMRRAVDQARPHRPFPRTSALPPLLRRRRLVAATALSVTAAISVTAFAAMTGVTNKPGDLATTPDPAAQPPSRPAGHRHRQPAAGSC